MVQDTHIVLPFARLGGKNLQADFDGGTLSSDGGVLFLREIEAHVGVIRRLAGALRDPRDSRYTDHSYEEMLRQRIFQIACGYDDANDCTPLRHDPAFKAACGRLPISDDPLASQPSMSRFENAPSRRDLYRTAQALFDTFVASYDRAPQSVLLDIDDTADEVHGAQQQSLFNGYYDCYCYLPLHLYEGQSGKLITSILRPGRRPTGQEIVSILKRVVGAIRREWPEVMILLRGDGHFSVPEVHEWCESQEPEIFYILGQSGNKVLKEKARGILQQAHFLYRCRQERYLRKKRQDERQQQKSQLKGNRALVENSRNEVITEHIKVKLYTECLYQAETWSEPRRIICKVEISEKGENIRFVVTNIKLSRKAYIYETIYCGRGQMENYIKDHKRFLHSDRTSCHQFEANQFRLFLHSAAYVLMHNLRTIGLRGTAWSRAQFDQIQLRVLKVGARIEEWKTRVRFHFPSSFPLKEVYARVMANLSEGRLCRSP
ncbi:MAG TPA: IS1380 family transposase [Pyrinomonadaceae bacterium]|nr:IS1380 family transposase [Pyrinomonadaceae bacterium]